MASLSFIEVELLIKFLDTHKKLLFWFRLLKFFDIIAVNKSKSSLCTERKVIKDI